MHPTSSVVAILVLLSTAASAQRRVDPTLMYERVYVILPLVGKGTLDDPIRPMFMPTPEQMKPGDRSGILAFHHQVSDDGKFALVEIVAPDRAALKDLLDQVQAQRAKSADVVVFDAGTQKRADIERAFRAKRRTLTSAVSSWWCHDEPACVFSRVRPSCRAGSVRCIHLLLHGQLFNNQLVRMEQEWNVDRRVVRANYYHGGVSYIDGPGP